MKTTIEAEVPHKKEVLKFRRTGWNHHFSTVYLHGQNEEL